MLLSIRSQMNEVEVTNIFKRYSDKKAERSHSWPGINYMWQAKYKKLGNG